MNQREFRIRARYANTVMVSFWFSEKKVRFRMILDANPGKKALEVKLPVKYVLVVVGPLRMSRESFFDNFVKTVPLMYV